MTTAASVREKLERRREANKTTGLQRIPFMLEQEVADRVEALAMQRQHLEERVEHLRERAAEEDAEGSRDVRGSGHDLSEVGIALAATDEELQRVSAELEAAVEEARGNTVELIFRRASADEYQQLLARAGGAAVDTDMAAAAAFQDALLERCFVRMEQDGQRVDMTWAEFLSSADLSFGELDPIRSLVYVNNRRGANTVPFSSARFGRTRT